MSGFMLNVNIYQLNPLEIQVLPENVDAIATSYYCLDTMIEPCWYHSESS